MRQVDSPYRKQGSSRHPSTPSIYVLRLQVGNFDCCTKKGLGDPGIDIRSTIRPGKGGGGGGGEGVGQQEGGGVLLFFPSTVFYGEWRKNEVP